MLPTCPIGQISLLGDGLPLHNTALNEVKLIAITPQAPEFRLINVAKVQVVLLEHTRTFASMSNLPLAGKDFKISRIKN